MVAHRGFPVCCHVADGLRQEGERIMEITPQMMVDAIGRTLAGRVLRDESLGLPENVPAGDGLYNRGFKTAVLAMARSCELMLPPGDTPEAWTQRIMSAQSQDV